MSHIDEKQFEHALRLLTRWIDEDRCRAMSVALGVEGAEPLRLALRLTCPQCAPAI